MDINDWKNITKEELLKLFNSGLFHKEIADLYNISSRAVYDKAKKFNLNLDRKNKSKTDKSEKICSRCGRKYKISPYNEICSYCGQISLNKDIYQKAITDLGKQILNLRNQGKSYLEISKTLNCSKSTISYYCTSNTKVLTRLRNRSSYSWQKKFQKKVRAFKTRKRGLDKNIWDSDWNKKWRSAVSSFQNRNKDMKSKSENFGYKYVLKEIGGTKQKCYLTGRSIDLEKDNYQLDHKIPVSKGGTNDISNMGIACPEANYSKSNLTIEEYLNLCKEVLLNFGYKIEDPLTK